MSNSIASVISINKCMSRDIIMMPFRCVPWNPLLRISVEIMPVAFNKSHLINIWMLRVKHQYPFQFRFEACKDRIDQLDNSKVPSRVSLE